ncbi:deaminase [Blattabacterium cuenoti]|uniref:deaminase n=1 Tax=Blattabacterium cuenoti TaxID=1653831 RepID=UPI001EEB2135|nr:deaminase [Blattabacterium cuenoti]
MLSYGYNKTPNGFNEVCEEKNGETKWYVIHAEENAILKLSLSPLSCKGSSIYITHFPCQRCCKLIYQSGIRRVVYLQESMKIEKELIFFKKLRIKIEKLNIINPDGEIGIRAGFKIQ